MSVLMVPPDEPRYPSLGGQVCQFIESALVFGPGDLRGQPAVLDPEKRALIWRIYEVFPREHPQAGRRRFKRVGLSLAKGLAKTELAAWIAACELHPEAPVRCIGWDDDGRPIGGPVTDPYIPMVAYTEEQSDELAYGALKAILEESTVAKDFDIGLERIMRKRGDGKAVSLASAPSSRDGARTTFQVCDETHWWVGDRLKLAYQTMSANLPKRKQADAWMLEVTTAYEPGRKSVAEGAMDYARAIAEGRASDARLFYFHRQASSNHDVTTEAGARAAVEEASGPAAAWRDIDGIVDLWRDPRTNRSFWERVWCNRIVQSTAQAFDITRWQELRERTSPVQDGDQIVLGFDGSLFRDATGIVATHIATGYQWVAGVWECPPNPPADWHVPTEEVDDVVAALFERYDVWRMYCDPPYWQSWTATWHGRYPDRVVDWWTNRRQPMTRALAGYADAIAEGTLSHDGHEAFGRHVANAYRLDLAQRDDQGKPLWLIQKERHDSPFKIDLAMAAVLSWQARTDAVSEGLLNAPADRIPTLWIPGVNIHEEVHE